MDEDLKTYQKAFNGDTILQDHVVDLIESRGITTVFETGTYKGDTTDFFADVCNSVVTAELREDYQKEAIENCGRDRGISYVLGTSPKAISFFSFLPMDKTMYFLDAHWYDYCPLLDEIKAIGEIAIEQGKWPVILIHDFKVPGRDFGYDSYGGQDYEWDWIEETVKEAYPNGFEYHYNEEARGSKRGVVMIIPKDEG